MLKQSQNTIVALFGKEQPGPSRLANWPPHKLYAPIGAPPCTPLPPAHPPGPHPPVGAKSQYVRRFAARSRAATRKNAPEPHRQPRAVSIPGIWKGECLGYAAPCGTLSM